MSTPMPLNIIFSCINYVLLAASGLPMNICGVVLKLNYANSLSNMQYLNHILIHLSNIYSWENQLICESKNTQQLQPVKIPPTSPLANHDGMFKLRIVILMLFLKAHKHSSTL